MSGPLTRREWLQQVGGWAAVAAVGSAKPLLLLRSDGLAHHEAVTGITTGFVDLDRCLGCLNAGDLIVLAGRPSMGKTTLALNMIERAAISRAAGVQRRPVILYFSLEMDRHSVARRLRSGEAVATEELLRPSIYIEDSAGLTMMSLCERARQQHARTGLDLVVVDYLQLLSFPSSSSRKQETDDISRSMKSLATELDVPIVALSQLSRGVELRQPALPELADLQMNGPIEQHADVVLLLYRPEYYSDAADEKSKGLAEVIVAKQRNGLTGTVRLRCFGSIPRFEDLTPPATVLTQASLTQSRTACYFTRI